MSETQTKTIRERVIGILEKMAIPPRDKITDSSRLRRDLGLDSLDEVDFIMSLEDEFRICMNPSYEEKPELNPVPDGESTFGYVVNYITSHYQPS